MSTFKDNAENEWKISIDAPSIMRIREECDEHFMVEKVGQESTYDRLLNDPVLLCRVIYVLCDKERKDRSISEEDFYKNVIGDAIDRATEAMLGAIVNFTPKRVREMIRTIAEKESQVQEKAVKMAMEKINDPETERKLLEEFEKKLDEVMPSSI